MSQPTAFVHTPLDLGSEQIRLLRIHDYQPEVHCTLEVYDRHSTPPYIALSYTWGTGQATHEIAVNGSAFLIGKNLWEFLVVARQQFSDDCFWIDQICIDQKNIDERNHQVRLMGNIYRNATYVVSWLGPADEDSDLAMDFLSELPPTKGWYTSQEPYQSLWPGSLVNLMPRVRNALGSLFMRPYWSRVWIVQEVMMAQHKVVVCGTKRIPFRSIHEFVIDQALYLVPGNRLSVFLGQPVIVLCTDWYFRFWKYTVKGESGDHWNSIFARSIMMDVDDSQYTALDSLIKAVHTYCEFQCADSRDKVYGFLGYLPGSEGLLEVNYSKTPKDVFWDFLHFALRPIHPRRSERSNFLQHMNIKELIEDWFLFASRLSTHMNLITPVLLAEVVNILKNRFEAFQSERMSQGMCWPGASPSRYLSPCSGPRLCCNLQKAVDVGQILQAKLEKSVDQLELKSHLHSAKSPAEKAVSSNVDLYDSLQMPRFRPDKYIGVGTEDIRDGVPSMRLRRLDFGCIQSIHQPWWMPKEEPGISISRSDKGSYIFC